MEGNRKELGSGSETPMKQQEEISMTEFMKHFMTYFGENKQGRVKEPNTYDGARDALVIDGWTRAVERYATFYDWSTERTCLFATTLLRERADAWFRTLEATNEAPITWLEFKRLLIDFFRPDNSNRIARDRLAALTQTGNLVDYINTFMDIKLAIPTMTDEEATDKFVRGLALKGMRAHIRQYEANTLKDAIHSALSYDSAQQEDDFQQKRPIVKSRADDPMDLDVMDQRRRNQQYYNLRQNNRPNTNYNNNKNECFYCQKPGHLKRNCRIRLADIKKLDEQHARRQKKDFQ